MRNEILLVAALLAAPTLVAQEKKGADAAPTIPNPKVKEHDALKALSGDWDVIAKMAAMPGIPGMEQATESKGTEHSELVCNGLFSKSIVSATHKGKPFQGIWIVGYDPFQKKYTTVWVSSEESDPACTGAGSYDEKSHTWTFTGKTPHGDERSTLVFKDNDNSVETSWLKGADGKEVQVMEITRKRASKATPPAVADATAKGAPKELEGLYESLGTWNADMKMAAGADHPAINEKCTEKCIPVCNGKWIWSDFNGQMMGAPFEGHGIIGYDPIEKKYVSFWIDSMGPVVMKTTGTCDAKKTCTLDGNCVDEEGKPMSVHQVVTQPDANTRNLHMEFKSAKGNEVMDIAYKKAPAKN